MKTLKILSLLAITLFTMSCSKDDDPKTAPVVGPTNYSEIQLSDIVTKESQMSTADLTATDATGIKWTPGTVVVYKTTDNHYGKFEVVSIDMSTNYAVTFKATNFNADGSVNNSTSNFLVNGTYLADIDIFVMANNTSSDFHWNRETSTVTKLAPKNGAKFYKYNF